MCRLLLKKSVLRATDKFPTHADVRTYALILNDRWTDYNGNDAYGSQSLKLFKLTCTTYKTESKTSF